MLLRKTWIIVSLCVMTILIVGIIVGLNNVDNISISEQYIQEKIESKIPFEQKKLRTIFRIDKFDFNLDNDLINMSFDANVSGFGKEIKVSATANGNLIYNSEKGNFNFKPENIRFSELEATGFKVSEGKKELIYAGVESAVSWYLNHFSVYKLPDDFKGKVAKIALKKVEIRDHTIIAHLSFWQLTKTVIIYGILLVLSIPVAIGFMMNADWLSFLLLGMSG